MPMASKPRLYLYQGHIYVESCAVCLNPKSGTDKKPPVFLESEQKITLWRVLNNFCFELNWPPSRYPIIPIQFGIKANMNWIGHLERVQVCFVNLILVALHFSELRWDVPLLISKSFTNEVTHHVKSPSTNYKNQVPKGVNECVPGYHHTSSPFFPHAFQHTVSFWCITVTVTQCCTRILNKPFQLIIWFITKNPYGSSIGVVKAISQQYFCLAMLFDKKLSGCKKNMEIFRGNSTVGG